MHTVTVRGHKRARTPWSPTHAQPVGDQTTTPNTGYNQTRQGHHSRQTPLAVYCIAFPFIYPRHLHAHAGYTSPVGA